MPTQSRPFTELNPTQKVGHFNQQNRLRQSSTPLHSTQANLKKLADSPVIVGAKLLKGTIIARPTYSPAISNINIIIAQGMLKKLGLTQARKKSVQFNEGANFPIRIFLNSE